MSKSTTKNKKDNMNTYKTTEKIIVPIIVAVITTLGVIFAAIIGRNVETVDDGTEKSTEIININIEGDGNSVINGDNGKIINQESINNYTTMIINPDYNFDDKTTEELLSMANRACINGEYDYAFDIYNHSSLSMNKVALLNLGYIYEYGLAYEGVDHSKAEECYEVANCIEGKRSLLSLYIKTSNEKVASLLCELLWIDNDDVVWDYISNCLFNKTWVEYSNDEFINKGDFEFNTAELYEWEYSDRYYSGANPPDNTEQCRWIFQGIDWDTGEGYNHPYDIYRQQVIKYSKGIDSISKLYCLNNNELYPLS